MGSTNLEKCARLIALKRHPGARLHAACMRDPAIPEALKRRIAMFHRQDGRISLAKLKADLDAAVAAVAQLGGLGWCLRADAMAKYTLPHEAPLPQDSVGNASGSPSASFVFEGINRVVGQYLGSGSYADVYLTDIDDVLIKLFKPNVAKRIVADTKLAVEEFAHFFSSDAHRRYADSTSFYLLKPDAMWKTTLGGDERQGYLVLKKTGSLKSRLTAIAENVDEVKGFVELLNRAARLLAPKPNFLHGDVKLDNLLYDDRGGVFLHDFDGGLVYDPDTLLHARSEPLERSLHASPMIAHPLLPFFCEEVLMKGEWPKSPSANLAKGAAGRWKAKLDTMGHHAIVDEIRGHINEILRSILVVDGADGANGDVEEFYFGKAVELAMAMVPFFDLYSLGASVLYEYIVLRKKGAPDDVVGALYDFAWATIEAAVTQRPPEATLGGGGRFPRPHVDVSNSWDLPEDTELNPTLVVLPVECAS